jgi:hypothetical protein
MFLITVLAWNGVAARCASGYVDAIERTSNGRGKNNDAVAVPGASVSRRHIAKDPNHSAGDVYGLQLSLGEETDVPAVRRPEGERGALGAIERLRAGRGEGSNPQHALSVALDRDERQRAPSGAITKLLG